MILQISRGICNNASEIEGAMTEFSIVRISSTQRGVI